MSVRVKICGITSSVDAEMAVEAGADMIGLNFFPESSRFVDLEEAVQIVGVIPPEVCRVGVFVDAPRHYVEEVRAAAELGALQFHGNESDELVSGWPCKVIRAFRIEQESDVQAALDSIGQDYYHFEGDAGGGYGGAGVGFDWQVAREVPRDRLIVAGGLTPANVADAVRVLRPFAVDVASGVESAPGVKDARATMEFIQNAKTA